MPVSAVDESISAILPEIRDLRREIHAFPEPGFEEVETAARVVRCLEPLVGLQIRTGIATTGVTAVLGADKPGPAVALRADMDCLPMPDTSGKPWASTRPGLAHACGHDGHTAALVGAARVLHSLRDRLHRPVKFIFQPAEESKGGGRHMVEAGVLEDPAVEAVFGLHGWPGLEVGTYGYCPGPMMAASDSMEIRVRGMGSHAALPHLGVDPVVIAAHIITALQALVSRETDPLDSAVVSVTQVNGGSAFNVIPDEVVLKGTVRTLREPVREHLHRRIPEVAGQVAALYRGSADGRVNRGYPVCVNHPAATRFFQGVFQDALRDRAVLRRVQPVMGGEDFAYFSEKVPGHFLFVGTCPRGESAPAFLHQSHYDFNDDALLPAIRAHVEVALRFNGLPPDAS